MLIEATAFENIRPGSYVSLFRIPGDADLLLRRSRDTDNIDGFSARRIVSGERVMIDSEGDTKDVARVAVNG